MCEVDQCQAEFVCDDKVIRLKIAMSKTISLMKVGYSLHHLGAEISSCFMRESSCRRPIGSISFHKKIKKGSVFAEGSQ